MPNSSILNVFLINLATDAILVINAANRVFIFDIACEQVLTFSIIECWLKDLICNFKVSVAETN